MNLKEYLVSNGIVHSYFAKQIDTTSPQLSMWLSGKAKPRLESIVKIEEITKGKVTVRDWIKQSNT